MARDIILKFRVNEQEKRDLEFKLQKAKINKSDFLRKSISSVEIKENDKEYQQKLLWLFNNIANNINQIAHYANIHKKLDTNILYNTNNILNYCKKIYKER